MNGDAIINYLDAGIPTFSADKDNSIDVYIASPVKLVHPETVDMQTLLAVTKSALQHLLTEANLFDAALTHDADVPNYDNIAGFTFDPFDNRIEQFFRHAYLVNRYVNLTLERADTDATISETKKIEYGMEARYYRAYAYSILLNYFGGVPVVLRSEPENPNPPRNSEQEVSDFILNECYEIYGRGASVVRYAAIQVAARVLLNQGQNYSAIADHLKTIIDSGVYRLPANYEWGGDAIGDGISYSSAEYPNVMRKGDMVYPVRYAETLLLFAEACNKSGNATEAVPYVNSLLRWKGLSGLPETATQTEVRIQIDHLWSVELNKEGHTFAYLKRNGLLMEKLRQYGATSKHQFLPIPAWELATNPNTTQNPGW
jgi:hypothetical protein